MQPCVTCSKLACILRGLSLGGSSRRGGPHLKLRSLPDMGGSNSACELPCTEGKRARQAQRSVRRTLAALCILPNVAAWFHGRAGNAPQRPPCHRHFAAHRSKRQQANQQGSPTACRVPVVDVHLPSRRTIQAKGEGTVSGGFAGKPGRVQLTAPPCLAQANPWQPGQYTPARGWQTGASCNQQPSTSGLAGNFAPELEGPLLASCLCPAPCHHPPWSDPACLSSPAAKQSSHPGQPARRMSRWRGRLSQQREGGWHPAAAAG